MCTQRYQRHHSSKRMGQCLRPVTEQGKLIAKVSVRTIVLPIRLIIVKTLLIFYVLPNKMKRSLSLPTTSPLTVFLVKIILTEMDIPQNICFSVQI